MVVVEEKQQKCGGGGGGGGKKTIDMWRWRKNNRNVVAVVVVEGKQLKCGGGGLGGGNGLKTYINAQHLPLSQPTFYS